MLRQKSVELNNAFLFVASFFSQNRECFFSIECFSVTLLSVMDVIIIKWKIVQKWLEIFVFLPLLPFLLMELKTGKSCDF